MFNSSLNINSNSNRMQLFGRFLECLIVTHNLDQLELSKILGISQSAVSKVINGKLTIDVFQWCNLSDFLKIPMESIRNCSLDSTTVSTIESGDRENGYFVPDEYSENRCVKVRYLLPIIRHMDNNLPSGYFENFLTSLASNRRKKKSIFLNRSFFLNLDNQVNLAFIEKLVLALKESNDYSNAASLVSKGLRYSGSHGLLSRIYGSEIGQIELAGKFIDNSLKYQSFILNSVTNKTVDHLSVSSLVNPSINDDFLSRDIYVRGFIEELIGQGLLEFTLFNIPKDVVKDNKFIINKKGTLTSLGDKLIFDLQQVS